MLFPLWYAFLNDVNTRSLGAAGLLCICLFWQHKPKTQKRLTKTILAPVLTIYHTTIICWRHSVCLAVGTKRGIIHLRASPVFSREHITAVSKYDDEHRAVWLIAERRTAAENICQIMWPSVYVNGLDQVLSCTVLIMSLYKRSLA